MAERLELFERSARLGMGKSVGFCAAEAKCDRADALVWALDDLLVRPRPKPAVWWP